ncbi:YdcP family protein [Oceanobacillus oncorhynchi subsp. oncorhynchi]|uniref:DUF961 family protein n=1 Tax=Oceanobacillus oncorhynchi TaxID=545501 RepID=UPI0031DF7EFE
MLNFIIPETEETFGVIEFASYDKENGEVTEGFGRNQKVIGRRFNLFSAKHKEGIEVILPPSVGVKQDLKYGDTVKLVNPKLKLQANRTNTGGFVNWLCYADDIVSA